MLLWLIKVQVYAIGVNVILFYFFGISVCLYIRLLEDYPGVIDLILHHIFYYFWIRFEFGLLSLSCLDFSPYKKNKEKSCIKCFFLFIFYLSFNYGFFYYTFILINMWIFTTNEVIIQICTQYSRLSNSKFIWKVPVLISWRVMEPFSSKHYNLFNSIVYWEWY